jgi:mRNA interferase RelE/StbE
MPALYGFAYTEAALKYLETVPAKFQIQIRRKIDALALNPYPQGCKKLKGVTDGDDAIYRIRSGDYRVLYVVKGSPHQIIVLDIDDRKDVYR